MTDARAAFTALVEAATRHQAAREWEAAAGAFVEAARVAVDAGALPAARQALQAAGDLFRRDDRPAEASRALRLALSYAASPAEGAVLHLQLAGVCGELGAAEEGLAHLDRAAAAAPEGLRGPILDTRLGLVLGHRRKEEARPLARALAEEGGAAAVAARFRQGQLARLDGDLPAARAHQREVLARLADQPGAEAGVGAARMELAECDLLDGDAVAAVRSLEVARREHEAAGRRGLALRAEAARVRAAAEAGLAVFPGPIREGLAYAEERGLVLLSIELRLAAAAALAGGDPAQARSFAEAAVTVADGCGARISAGRGRAILAGLSAGAERERHRAQARADLADHVLLARRLDADAAGAAPSGADPSPPELRVARADQHVEVPWKNGRGTTLELMVEPPGTAFGAGRCWRLSAAPVAEDGPFSSFPGVARTLVLLDGPELVLQWDGHRDVLDTRFAVARFPGDAPVVGRVPRGPIRDLNWMVDAALAHRGEVRRGEGTMPAAPGRQWVVVPLDAPATAAGVALAPLEVVACAGGSWRADGAVFVGWVECSGTT